METDDKKKKKSDTHPDLDATFLEAKTRFENSVTAEYEQRRLAIEDYKFVWEAGSMWDDYLARHPQSTRPRFEVNRIQPAIKNVLGENRQNQVSIKVRSTQGEEGKKSADIMAGIIRSIENRSHFRDTKDNCLKEVATSGFGAWYIERAYHDSDSYFKELTIKWIPSAATSVFYDPSAKMDNKQDADWFVVLQEMSMEAYKKKYPDASMSTLETQSGNQNSYTLNQDRKTITIGDYWVKEPVKRKLFLMSDGSVYSEDDIESVVDELAAQGITVVDERIRNTHKIVHYKINGSEIIEPPHDWPGKYLPIVPVFGFSSWIEGNHIYEGIARPAKDSQMLYNTITSLITETAALAPKNPIYITAKQIEGREAQIENWNEKNNPFFVYEPDPEQPGPPSHGPGPVFQQSLVAILAQNSQDIDSISGYFAPAKGDAQFDQSGKAIYALQRQTSTSVQTLIDQLTKAVAYTGEILLDLIPKTMDIRQTVTILGEDGDLTQITINDVVIDEQTGEEVVINDLSKGSFELTSASGPSFETRRVETLSILTELSKTNPDVGAVSGDIIAGNIDFKESGELKKRIRRQMLAQGLVEPNQEELEAMQQEAGQEPSYQEKLAMDKLMLENEMMAANVDLLGINRDKVIADITHKRSQTNVNLGDALLKKMDANLKGIEAGVEVNLPVDPQEILAAGLNLEALTEEIMTDMEEPLDEKRLGKGTEPPQ